MPTFHLTDSQQQALLAAARQARRNAYAPYSNYPVGAAVLDAQGRIHAGCNVENAAYPQRPVRRSRGAGGGRQARTVLVVGNGGEGSWITHCGGCRQKLREFGARDLTIQSANATELGPRTP